MDALEKLVSGGATTFPFAMSRKERGPQNHFPIAYFQALDCLFRTDLDRTEEYQIKMLSPGYLLDQSSTAAHSKISDGGLLVRKNGKRTGFFTEMQMFVLSEN